MIIGFWNECNYSELTTDNMLAASVMTSNITGEKVVLIQGKYDRMKIDYAFTPIVNVSELREDYAYYNKYGIDAILEGQLNHTYSANMLDSMLVRVKGSNLYYLPATTGKEEKLFNHKYDSSIEIWLDSLKDYKGMVFLDMNSGLGRTEEKIFKKLDLLVVNVGQNIACVNNMQRYKKYSQNVMVMVGKYDIDSNCNILHMKREIGACRDEIGIIPYDIKFKDSVYDGSVKDFFDRNAGCDKYSEHYNFFKGVRVSTELMLKKVGKFGKIK